MVSTSQTLPIAATQGAYVPELDGMRAISILMVMLGHAGYLFIPAALGVTIFFVISGYLICGMLLRERTQSGSLNLPAFYMRRLLRLYPELIVYLAVLVAICVLSGWTFQRTQFAAGILYFTNYLQIYGHINNSISYITRPLWSLSVEEHFYLIFPFLVLATAGDTRKLGVTLLLTIVLIGALRSVLFNLWSAPQFYFEYATESRVDAVCGGCLLACIAQGAEYRQVLRLFAERGWFYLASGMSLILLAVLFRNVQFRETWRFSFEAAGSTLLLGAILWGTTLEGPRELLRSPLLTFLGRLSYAAYLYHLLVYALLAKLMPVDNTAYRLLAISLSFAAAFISFSLIEIPFRPLRRRFRSPSPSPASRVGASDAVSV